MRRTWNSRLKPGQPAPFFNAILHDGSVITSSSFYGKRLILFFYNHDGSETCTNEAVNMRDHFDLLTQKGFTILGVSEDSIKKHQKFITKYNLPYGLISDKDNTLAKLFDIYGTKEFMGRTSDAVHRTTFVISTDWEIETILHPVDSSNHALQILTELNIPTQTT
jgi:peroxiredoxin Q/BCP